MVEKNHPDRGVANHKSCEWKYALVYAQNHDDFHVNVDNLSLRYVYDTVTIQV